MPCGNLLCFWKQRTRNRVSPTQSTVECETSLQKRLRKDNCFKLSQAKKQWRKEQKYISKYAPAPPTSEHGVATPPAGPSPAPASPTGRSIASWVSLLFSLSFTTSLSSSPTGSSLTSGSLSPPPASPLTQPPSPATDSLATQPQAQATDSLANRFLSFLTASSPTTQTPPDLSATDSQAEATALSCVASIFQTPVAQPPTDSLAVRFKSPITRPRSPVTDSHAEPTAVSQCLVPTPITGIWRIERSRAVPPAVPHCVAATQRPTDSLASRFLSSFTASPPATQPPSTYTDSMAGATAFFCAESVLESPVQSSPAVPPTIPQYVSPAMSVESACGATAFSCAVSVLQTPSPELSRVEIACETTALSSLPGADSPLRSPSTSSLSSYSSQLSETDSFSSDTYYSELDCAVKDDDDDSDDATAFSCAESVLESPVQSSPAVPPTIPQYVSPAMSVESACGATAFYCAVSVLQTPSPELSRVEIACEATALSSLPGADSTLRSPSTSSLSSYSSQLSETDSFSSDTYYSEMDCAVEDDDDDSDAIRVSTPAWEDYQNNIKLMNTIPEYRLW